MIKHIVMWKLKDFAEGNDKQTNSEKIKNELESLKNHIKEIKRLEIGINLKDNPFGNFDIVLICEFENFFDLEKYQSHPKHKEFVEFISNLRDIKASVDYEIL